MCPDVIWVDLEHIMCPGVAVLGLAFIWRWGWPGEGESVAGILPTASAQDGELVQYQATEGGTRYRI